MAGRVSDTQEGSRRKDAVISKPWILLACVGAMAAPAACGTDGGERLGDADGAEAGEEGPAPSRLESWDQLGELVGSYPHDVALFEVGPLARELEGLLGADMSTFIANMDVQGPLQREDVYYVTGNREHQGGQEDAYLLIDPDTHDLEIGLVHEGELTIRSTSARSLPLPGDVRTILMNGAGEGDCRTSWDAGTSGTMRFEAAVTGYDYCEYRIAVSAGGTLDTTVTSDGPARATYYRTSARSAATPVTADRDTVFVVRVAQPRARARRSPDRDVPFTVAFDVR